jgi:hypothetical protein
LALRLSTSGRGVDVGVSVARGVRVNVSVGIGVNVSGTVVVENVWAWEMFVGDESTTGEGETGAVPPVRLQARVVRTSNTGIITLFIFIS